MNVLDGANERSHAKLVEEADGVFAGLPAILSESHLHSDGMVR